MATIKTPARGLTDAFIENLKPDPSGKRYELADKKCPGLRLRVTKTGIKTFCWYYNLQGKQKVVILGRYPDLSLAKGRSEVERLKERKTESPALIGLNSTTIETVKDLAEDFYTNCVEKHRRRPEWVRYQLDKDILPALGHKRLITVETQHIGATVRAVVNRGATVHAGTVLATLRQMFGHAAAVGALPFNIAQPLKAEALGVEKGHSDRTLNASEIQKFLSALDEYRRLHQTTRLGLKLLLLLGVRSGELLRAEWSNVDLQAGIWTVPSAHQKASKQREKKLRPWAVPLSPQALVIFEELLELAGKNPYVMASPRKPNQRLEDKVFGHTTRRLLAMKHDDGTHMLDIPAFSPHDLRRTLRTRIEELGFAEPHVAERLLNHSLGGMIDVYNTADYFDERRNALTKWGNWVDLVSSDDLKIAALPKRDLNHAS